MSVLPIPYEIIRRDDGQAALSFNLDALEPALMAFASLNAWRVDVDGHVELLGAGPQAVRLTAVPPDVVVQARQNGFLRVYGFAPDGRPSPLRLTELGQGPFQPAEGATP